MNNVRYLSEKSGLAPFKFIKGFESPVAEWGFMTHFTKLEQLQVKYMHPFAKTEASSWTAVSDANMLF